MKIRKQILQVKPWVHPLYIVFHLTSVSTAENYCPGVHMYPKVKIRIINDNNDI